MRITCIVQRYGPDVVGGAERLCRGVAEGLAARGHDVEVLTTCARSYLTWANAYPEGTEVVQGVRVRRFRADRERQMEAFNARSEELFSGAHDADDERAWVEAQGPVSKDLLHVLHSTGGDRDRLLFFTYLYHPTVHGIHVAPHRSVLVPTAHDEAPLYLRIYDRVFELPAGMVFNTEAEEALVRRRFSRLPRATAVIGVGIDGLDELAERVATPPDSSPRPGASADQILYAGRIEEGKGVGRLIDHLRRFRRQTGRDVTLWLMGEAAMELPDEPWIVPLGFVSEAEKAERLRRATVLALPSRLESFGIVALEAMAAGTPVLADAGGAAGVEHCRRGDAGLFYRDAGEFREALELLLTDGRLRAALTRNGASYVRENYSWPRVVERYEEFLEALA